MSGLDVTPKRNAKNFLRRARSLYPRGSFVPFPTRGIAMWLRSESNIAFETMPKHPLFEDQSPRFSPSLRDAITLALAEYMELGTDESGEKLEQIGHRVCSEAKTARLPVEKVLVAMHQLVGWKPHAPASIDADRHEKAYDRLISACIRVYFGGRKK